MTSFLKEEYGVDITEQSLKDAARASRLNGNVAQSLTGKNIVVGAKTAGESSTLVSGITADGDDNNLASTVATTSSSLSSKGARPTKTKHAAVKTTGLQDSSPPPLPSTAGDKSALVIDVDDLSPSKVAAGLPLVPFDPTDEQSPTSKRCLAQLGEDSPAAATVQTEEDLNQKPAAISTGKAPALLATKTSVATAPTITKDATSAAKKASPRSKKPAAKKASPRSKKPAAKNKAKSGAKQKSPVKRNILVRHCALSSFGVHKSTFLWHVS